MNARISPKVVLYKLMSLIINICGNEVFSRTPAVNSMKSTAVIYVMTLLNRGNNE